MNTKYINANTRVYEQQDGTVVAVAIEPIWGGGVVRDMDLLTRYYCLFGVWEANYQTCIVSPKDLERLIGAK